jgi:hypothetical protein
MRGVLVPTDFSGVSLPVAKQAISWIDAMAGALRCAMVRRAYVCRRQPVGRIRHRRPGS